MNVIDSMIKKLTDFEANISEYIKQEVIEDEAIILDMNTQNQLFEQGINSMGVKISSYAPYTARTKEYKALVGQSTNRVTLRDEGDFYNSFTLIVDDSSFFIDATDLKTAKLAWKYGDDILGLTTDNMNELAWDYIYPMLLEKLNNL